MVIYCIGGLGADARIFSGLKTDLRLVPLSWDPPNVDESLSDYAKRLANRIDQSQPFYLLGVSFGGVIALELNKYTTPVQTILVSSTTHPSTIPLPFRVLGKVGFFRLVPKLLLKPPMTILYWLFGVSQPEHKKLLKDIIADTDTTFLRWALIKLATWKGSTVPDNLVQIHGENDRLIFFPKKSDVIKIAHGGHFIIVDEADKISASLKSTLKSSF